MSFSGKNDAKSFINFVKKSFLDPQHAKLVQKSLRKVYGKYTESPGPVQEDPYGPIRSPYGPIRAHMGPNPDRAPTRTGLTKYRTLLTKYMKVHPRGIYVKYTGNK